MKNAKGLLLSAAFVVVVLIIAFKVSFTRNLILGSSTAS